MDENLIFKKAAETFTNKPKNTIEITPKPKNWIDKILIKLRLKQGKIKYTLTNVLVGNRVRIASRAVLFPENSFSEGVLKGLFNLSVNHNDDLIYIAAVAIQNNRDEPSDFLLEELKWIDDSLLFTIVDAALSQIDLQSFMKSTILITGTEMMKKPETEKEMGPDGQRETIAPGEL